MKYIIIARYSSVGGHETTIHSKHNTLEEAKKEMLELLKDAATNTEFVEPDSILVDMEYYEESIWSSYLNLTDEDFEKECECTKKEFYDETTIEFISYADADSFDCSSTEYELVEDKED